MQALLAGLFPAVAAYAQALPDLGGRTVVVVTENAYPPLQFIDPKTGKQVGWEYDAMNEIAKRLNFKVEYQNTSWDAMIQAVSDGQYDIGMTGITIKDDRKEKVDFSDPYMRSEQFMLVRGDESRFTDAKSFAAFKDGLVGAQAGTTPFYTAVYSVLDGNEQNPRIKLFETFGATVQALKTGDVDMVLTDGTAGKGYVDASDGELKLVGGPLGTEDFGFIFKKGSDLVAPVNAAIAAHEGRRHDRCAEQEVVPRLQDRGVSAASGKFVTVRTPGQGTALTRGLAANSPSFPGGSWLPPHWPSRRRWPSRQATSIPRSCHRCPRASAITVFVTVVAFALASALGLGLALMALSGSASSGRRRASTSRSSAASRSWCCCSGSPLPARRPSSPAGTR